MGLYYLQSRYYDPEMGRFLNADAYISTGQGELGNNMLAYCNNSPIRYTDPFGTQPIQSLPEHMAFEGCVVAYEAMQQFSLGFLCN